MQIQKKIFEGSDLTTEGLVGDFPKITKFLILTQKNKLTSEIAIIFYM